MQKSAGDFFCPLCGNFLLADASSERTMLICRAPFCQYRAELKQTQYQEAELDPLDVKSFVTNGDALEMKKVTTVECEKCHNDKAFYTEIQIRSADEPTTVFYECTNCGHKWREG